MNIIVVYYESISVTGSSDNVNFEDITASIDLTADLKDDVVCFSSVCTGRYVYKCISWLKFTMRP